MSVCEVKNAVIKSARIDMGDRGLLTAWLDLDYGGSGQGFGGYALYLPKSYDHHKLESVAGHFLFRVMEVAGVERWDQLPGKTVRVRAQHCGVEAIGHIVKDDWFCPRDDFAALDRQSARKAAEQSKEPEADEDEGHSSGPYTCCRCTAGTWNDDDWFAACRAEAAQESQPESSTQ